METAKISALKGGEWLIKPGNPNQVFTPEDFTEEQLMIRDMCHQFFENRSSSCYGQN